MKVAALLTLAHILRTLAKFLRWLAPDQPRQPFVAGPDPFPRPPAPTPTRPVRVFHVQRHCQYCGITKPEHMHRCDGCGAA